jgi:hypothetical protein
MGTGDPFLGVKRGLDATLTTHPHLVQKSRKRRSYISSPPYRLYGGSGTALLYFSQVLTTSIVRAIAPMMEKK